MDKEKICKIVNSMLSQYIENKLPPEQYRFVHRHLDKCPNCKKRYETRSRKDFKIRNLG